MTLEDYNTYCAGLGPTTHVVQWGGAHVWKIGGKVFSIAGWSDDEATLAVTFKTSEIAFEVLRDEPGCRPAPYLASRGMKWIQHYQSCGLDEARLKDHISASYEMIAKALPRKKKTGLGLNL